LKPEKISTTGLQFFYRAKADYYSFNIFHSEISDIIVQDQSPTSTPINSGKATSYGAEMEWYTKPTNALSFEGNFSWQRTEDDAGNKDFRLLPKWHAKVGLDYRYSSRMNVGIYNMSMPAIKNPGATETNPSSKAFNNLTVNVKMSLNDLFNLNTASRHNVALYMSNLLEKDPLYQPDEFLGDAVNAFPWRAGRGIYLVYDGQWE
jgi:outer membrane receptor protein involved in Fe transport